MKMIKIENHYYVIDDSQQVSGCIAFNPEDKTIQFFASHPKYDETGLKVTHSTKELHGVIKLNLADIEEAIYGYNVDRLALEKYPEDWREWDINKQYRNEWIKGFKDCQELMKDKLFTTNDMLNAFREGTNAGACYESLVECDSEDAEEFSKQEFDEFQKSLLPKTEWEIEIQENKILIK